MGVVLTYSAGIFAHLFSACILPFMASLKCVPVFLLDATVYVGGLDEKVSEPLLWELFLQAGPVVNTHMPKDRVTGQHQGLLLFYKADTKETYAIGTVSSLIFQRFW